MALDKQEQQAAEGGETRDVPPSTPPPPPPPAANSSNAAGEKRARGSEEEEKEGEPSKRPTAVESGPSKRPRAPTEHWKPAEDMKLRYLVARYGTRNWTLIGEIMGKGRTGKSCRLRWINQLNPKINKEAYTAEEGEILVEAQKEYGNRWTHIARMFFPGRTDNSLKNHWHVMMKRMKRGKYFPPRRSNSTTRLFPSNGYRYRHLRTHHNAVGPSSTINPPLTVTNVGTCACNRNGERGRVPYVHEDRRVTLRTPACYSSSYEINGSKVPFFDFLGVGRV